MNPPSILSRVSKSTREANPQIFGDNPEPQGLTTQVPNIRTKRGMNKTENEYALLLEAQKRRGDIYEYFYEGITLHWGKGMRYTPDFVVYDTSAPIPLPTLIEIKGGHIWDRDKVRFKGCSAEWDRFYNFQLWQKKAGTWSRLL